MSKPRRVAVLGGSFDPLTLGHLLLVSEILHFEAADEVWLVPCGDGRTDKILQCSAKQRYDMAKLGVQGEMGEYLPRVRVDPIEVEQGWLHTADLMRQ
jgi:cytidyltransferase-like protein